MPENASVFNLTVLGAEGTAGIIPTMGTVIPAFGLTLNPEMTFQPIKPMGYKVPTEVAIGKNWASFTLDEGQGCFNSIVYPLSGVMGTATITAGSVTSWVFTPSATAADTDKTFTIQNGNSVRAIQANYGRFTSFGYEITREKMAVTGGGFAKAITEGATLAGTTKTVAIQPMLPGGFTVYADPTSGALGTTKLARLLSAKYDRGDKANPLWTVDSSNTSFVADVEVAPPIRVTIQIEHDAQAGTVYNQLLGGTRLFMRVKGTGDAIQGGTAYTFQHDMALEAAAAPSFDDSDGVRTMTYQYNVVYDATWAKLETVQIYNTQTGL